MIVNIAFDVLNPEKLDLNDGTDMAYCYANG